MKKEIKILITLSRKFISVNALYNCRVQYIGGKPRAVMYKNPEANKVEAEIRNQLLAVDFSDYKEWLRDTEQFELELKFILKRNVSRRDVSNEIKHLEDDWVRFVVNDLGIENYDDSKHVKVVAEKYTMPGADNEYALLTLRESKANIRYDKIQKPEKIWINSLSAEETTALLPPLPKKLKKKERYLVWADYDTADTKIYFLSPDNKISPLMAGKIYKDIISTSREDGKFLCIGILPGNNDEEIIDWLKEEISEVNTRNNIIMDEIEKKEDILKWIK